MHKSNRPLNDIYPHIYKDHSDQEYVDKYMDNLNFDKGPRYRRQLAEDVEVDPQSSRGNLQVLGMNECEEKRGILIQYKFQVRKLHSIAKTKLTCWKMMLMRHS